MSAVEILALALLGSVGLSAFTLFAAPVAERISADPLWRDRLWSAAFWVPVAAPLSTALFLLLPSPPAAPAPVATVFQLVETGARATTPATTPAASAPWIDGTTVAVVVLAAAGLLSVLRLAWLVLRARRLARVIDRSAPATPELAALIDGRPGARPDLRVSGLADEAFLAGLRRPVLVVPESLTVVEPGAVMAVVEHELAHLRRKDLVALWLEEAARVVLAGNPLLPVLHARRSLAREEACDALALHGASASARRLYARALIDAFRHRAATPVPGLALTFTGNKGQSAMRRIKSVLEPRPAAGRLVRRLSLAAAVMVGGAVCAGSLALAGQREGERPTPSETAAVIGGYDRRTDAASESRDAAQAAAQTAWDRLSPDQQARLRDPSGPEFRSICRSDDPADVGYCMGVILSVMSDEAVERAACASSDEHTAVMRAQAAVVQVPSWPNQRPIDIARLAVAAGSPCDRASAEPASSPIPLIVRVEVDGHAPVLAHGEAMHIVLTDENSRALWTYMTNVGGRQATTVQLPVERQIFPKVGQANRMLQLNASIQRADGQVVRASEPMTLRLAPMSEGSVSRMRPVLSLRSQT